MQSRTDITIKWQGLEDSFDRLQRSKYGHAYVVLDSSLVENDRVTSMLERCGCQIGILVDHEPTTGQVNTACDTIRTTASFTSVVGIGGGSAMDLAKAIAVTAANGGRAEKLQGWDLPTVESLPTLVVPTIPGTGAEISRTAVLKGPERKLGINSDFTIPDDCIVDASLFTSVRKEHGVPTLMDCYIHCVEVVRGRYSDSYAVWVAEDIINRFEDILKTPYDAADRKRAELYAYCSYLGGLGLLGGVVGACHGLSYGLSHALNISHSYANVVAMDVLDDYYGDEVSKVRTYCAINDLDCWARVTNDNRVTPDTFNKVMEGSLFMEKLWANAARTEDEALPRARETILRMNRLIEARL